jgi:hypothetical protein
MTVVLAKARTHTAESIDKNKKADAEFDDVRPW